MDSKRLPSKVAREGAGVSALRRLMWVDDRHRYQGDAQVPDFPEQPMQLRLVRDETAEAGRAVAFVGQGEVTEPGRPVVVEVPVDPELVARGRLLSGRLGDHVATLVLARLVRWLVTGRRMTYSATARLMTQPAPSVRSVVSSPVPKTALPTPWVNAWVPAPRARAYARVIQALSLIHISEPTRRTPTSYAVFCLKKNNN